jgi:hypothetical protein
MNHAKSIPGYIWAAAAPIVMLGLIIGMGFWQDILFTKPGVTISANFAGGEIQNTIIHANYVTKIHKPVFDGFFGDNKNGFVLIDWVTETEFPQIISENIDYDNDGKDDFEIFLDTDAGTVKMQPLSTKVISISYEGVMVLKNQKTIRVYITK